MCNIIINIMSKYNSIQCNIENIQYNNETNG